MIAKIWQKLGLIILIIVCLFNIVIKIVTKISLQEEIDDTVAYMKEIEGEKNL